MAYNFPDSPTVGQISNGYVWDGTTWNVIGSESVVYLPLTGGTLTGPLGMSGAHVNGIDLTTAGAAYSGNAFMSPGFAVTGAGDVAWTGAVWAAYSPIITGAGGFVGTATGRFKRLGKTVAMNAAITCTAGGTVSDVTLPVQVSNAFGGVLIGRDSVVTGFMWMGALIASASGFPLSRYDNVNAIAAGQTIQVSGTYESV